MGHPSGEKQKNDEIDEIISTKADLAFQVKVCKIPSIANFSFQNFCIKLKLNKFVNETFNFLRWILFLFKEKSEIDQ